jgi:hypothetical protein
VKSSPPIINPTHLCGSTRSTALSKPNQPYRSPFPHQHAHTTRDNMDDHHHQPIWPMIQGAANYAWNLIEEAWGMIWKPAEERTVRNESGGGARVETTMREVDETREVVSAAADGTAGREERCGG